MNKEHDYHKEEVFERPIEAGHTSQLPQHVEPEDQDPTLSDNFELIAPGLDVQPRSIVLPKFVFNNGLGYKEKGLLLLGYEADHMSQIYSKILKAANDGFKKFEIAFKDLETNKVVSVWKFYDARIHAVDFGFVATEKAEHGELAVEVDYRHLEIDGTGL